MSKRQPLPAAARSRALAGPVRIEYQALGELLRAPRNPKAHDLDTLGESFGRFGYVTPVVINEGTGRLVAGHGRLEALQAAKAAGAAPPERVKLVRGEWMIPVLRGIRFKTEQEAEAYLLADNQLAIKAGWDSAGLDAMLRDLTAADALEGTGFTAVELEASMRPAAPAEIGRATELQRKWQTASGQAWEIPSATTAGALHRIVCGDARAWWTLMHDERAQVVFTDPPYGVDYQAAGHAKIEGDAHKRDKLTAFLVAALRRAAEYSDDEAAFYVWHASATRKDFEWALEHAGLEERQYLIWVKEAFTLGHSDYHYQHEPCFYAGKAGQRPRFTTDRSQTTVWRFAHYVGEDLAVAIANGLVLSTGAGGEVFVTTRVPAKRKLRTLRPEAGEAVRIAVGGHGQTDTWEISRDEADYDHPTQKPAELAERALRNSSNLGEIVVDCFAGSGSTLVGAERCGRVARLLELDPKYVAVTLERCAELGLAPRQAA